jgi:DNA-directed RNA polymerase, omega subunit
MNMLEPTLDELVNKVGNRYTLVAIISKRARQIVDDSIRNEIANIKPVSEAVTDLEDDCLNWTEA